MVAMQCGQGVGGLLAELFQVMGREVGLTAIFHLAPTTFYRVQLRTVRRQILKPEPRWMPERKIFRRLEMHSKVVPNENESMTKMMVQLAEKRIQNRRVDVRRVQLKRKIHSPLNRGHRQRFDPLHTRWFATIPGRCGPVAVRDAMAFEE